MKGTQSRKRIVSTSSPVSTSSIPNIQFLLSRSAYPSGGTVVGTIFIQQRESPRNENGSRVVDDGINTNATGVPLRSLLHSVTVYVAGFCKIDARWHDCTNYTKIYGSTHPYLKVLRNKFDSKLLEQNKDLVCIWATNGMEALDLPERSYGRRWKNSETDFQRGLFDNDIDDDDSFEGNLCVETENENPINRDVLAFTFRVNIPGDLPHSVHATTCRYFYTAKVLIKTATEQQSISQNFQIFSAGSESNENSRNHCIQNRSGTRVKFGNCFGLAHSNGLPCHLSTTEIQRPKEQLMVVQNCPVLQYQQKKDIQTLRVSNASDQAVCVLTVIGSQSMCPGSCIHLQWNFPRKFQRNRTLYHSQNHGNKHTHDWIPCHQVAACLRGEEFAIYEDGNKKRTQSFLFDTCHELVDPGVTDRISKTLWLSSNGVGNNENTSHFEGGAPPCDLKTDVMEVSTWCQVDITVEAGENNIRKEGGGDYQNLSLRIPCRVKLHKNSITAHDEHDRMEREVQPLNELLDIGAENILFPTNDIRSDLKKLSFKMEELLCSEKNRVGRGRFPW